MTTQPEFPTRRSPLRKAGGCLVTGFFLYLEVSLAIAIPVLMTQKLGPSLAARGYNPDIGAGFMLGLVLGAIVAIYPVIWLDRLRRRLGG